MKYKQIICVDSHDFPEEVNAYCDEIETNMPFANDLIRLKDDGNVLSEWLKKEGYVFSFSEYGDHIAITT